MSLETRRALVTGGAGGIGMACARMLAERGATVVIADHSAEALQVALAYLPEGMEAVQLDVRDRAAQEAAFAAQAAKGGVDILVTTAAVARPAPILEFDPDSWQEVLDINLNGVFHSCQLAGRQMVEKGWGRLITLSSVNGQIANPGRGAYSCSKSAGDMLTKLLAAELGDKGVTANAVAPSPVGTAMVLQMQGQRDRAAWHAATPVPRIAEPAEVASAVCFLASEEAAYINGHILNLDGGFMAAGILPGRQAEG